MYQCSKKPAKYKVLTILTFHHIQYLHLMDADVVWVLVSSETQVQPQIILDPDYLPDYLFVSYDYVMSNSSELNRLLPQQMFQRLYLVV